MSGLLAIPVRLRDGPARPRGTFRAPTVSACAWWPHARQWNPSGRAGSPWRCARSGARKIGRSSPATSAGVGRLSGWRPPLRPAVRPRTTEGTHVRTPCIPTRPCPQAARRPGGLRRRRGPGRRRHHHRPGGPGRQPRDPVPGAVAGPHRDPVARTGHSDSGTGTDAGHPEPRTVGPHPCHPEPRPGTGAARTRSAPRTRRTGAGSAAPLSNTT